MSRAAIIKQLKEDIARGSLTIIAGTGVSVSACRNQQVDGHAVATWKGLLEHGIAQCLAQDFVKEKIAGILRQQVESGDVDQMIQAAETLTLKLQRRSPGVFLGWLQQTVGKLELKDRSVVDALLALGGTLATLNYDNLLSGASGRSAVTWRKPNAVQEVLRGARPGVLHLHDWYDEPESVVLGLGSYLDVQDDVTVHAPGRSEGAGRPAKWAWRAAVR